MTIKTWQETVGVAPDDDEYRYPCAMQDEIDELRREINKKQEAYESALTGWSDQIALVNDLCAQCKELRAALAAGAQEKPNESKFDELCREYEIAGTPEARLCRVFFEAGKRETPT